MYQTKSHRERVRERERERESAYKGQCCIFQPKMVAGLKGTVIFSVTTRRIFCNMGKKKAE